ncbi:carbohydrate ABC transporter permease [Hungatella hathewayi]|mgnify:CR=1 FL=1|uniref:carbohydrate ABC transporter permease n=1 Tax=Hungatella hathewayi TaxID=154046 RepID=UPI00033BB279|nr:carbohydrate ABC transporter permease [Hungatella hathewayi]CCZ62972.1 binding-protein-dependent transport systems inner membrane component [Hungatella hathewayi CAG:224]
MAKTKKAAMEILTYAFIGIMVIFTIYPIIYTVLGSFKTNSELTLGGSFFPTAWHFENYVQAFIEADFVKYTFNSVAVSIAVMVIATLTASLAGFTFARREFAGKKIIMCAYVGLMFVALGSVTLYPIYSLLTKLHLNKTILGLILALTGGQASNVMLTMGFVKSIPKELDEAATIDGSSIYGIFFKIILPLIKPIMAVVALFSFRSAWNDYITTLVMSISLPKLRTLTVAVVQLKYSANAAAEWHIMLAGASIAIIPILIVYAFCHKQFIGGLTAGAVKG